jgi:hypothetical protein
MNLRAAPPLSSFSARGSSGFDIGANTEEPIRQLAESSAKPNEHNNKVKKEAFKAAPWNGGYLNKRER